MTADYLSRPNQPISIERSLHPEIVKRIFRLWGTPEVDMFATVCNSHLPQFMSSFLEPRALAVDALSQDWQGRSMYMFPPFPAHQSHSEALVHPGSRSNSRSPLVTETVVVFHTYFVFVSITPVCFPYHRDLLSQQDQKYVLDGKLYHLHAWRPSCDTIKQQAFQTRSLGSPQPLRGPQPIACTTIGGFALLLGPQGKDLIRLIP